MNKNYVENSLKRFLKRKVKITTGFVVAFLITGTVGFAEVDYYAKEENITIEKIGDITARVNTSLAPPENVNRYTALGAEGGKTLTVNTDGKINIVNDTTVINPERLYGITLNGGANANITANEINFNISGTNQSVRGIRNNSGKNLTINGNITGELSNKSNDLVGIDAWSGAEVIVNGNTDLTLNSSEGRIMGVQNFSGKNVEFNGDFEATLTKGENNGSHFQGVNSNKSITDFNGNTEITMINNSNSDVFQQNHIIDIQCDRNDKTPTFVNFNGDKTILTLTSTGKSSQVNIGIRASGGGPGGVNFNGGEAVINVTSENSKTAIGLKSQYGANVTSKNGTNININVVNNSKDTSSTASGIVAGEYANYNGNITLNGSVNITAQADVGKSFGILNVANDNVEDTKDGKVVIGENLKISSTSKTGQAVGVYTTGIYGETKLNGNTVIEVKGNEDSYALTASDSGKIDITGKDKLVQITGNINADTQGVITTNLSTSNSFINGTITDNNANGTINLGMSKGATWNNTGNSSVTNLDLNGGIINNSSVDNNITVGTLTGNGGAVNMVTEVVDGKATSGKLTVDKVDGNNKTALDVNFTGITADDVTTEEFKNLATNGVTGNGLANLDTTVNVEEGLTSGAITGEIGKDGITNLVQNSSTSTIDGLQALTTNTYIAWKQEMNSLNKRMGELRNSTGNEGVWYRIYAGESEYNKGYKNEYQTYQVGYDKKYSTPNGTGFVGYLVSYTDGDTKYNHNSYGSGENTSVGGGIYGTWLGNCGSYIDLIFKVSRLENEYDVTSKSGIKSSGDYNTFGMSLSAEFGKRFDLTKGLFLEPSVEMSLGRVGSQDYRTSSGLDIEQDTIYTAEGKVGTALGYNFDRGNVYLRVAGVKELEGELDTTINGTPVSEDLGDSWIEYGVGANYRVLENLNIYADLEKTGSAKVETNWQANLGFRYEF